jgi:hypothetical protein
MRKFLYVLCLVASVTLLACGGVDCTFSGADWGFTPNTRYTATWQDPTSSLSFDREVTSDANGDIHITGDGSANCSEFGFSRCYSIYGGMTRSLAWTRT